MTDTNTSNHQPKILIVEDNPNSQKLFRDAFEAAGFHVVTTGEAEGNFVEAVLNFMPDIISMDIMIGKPQWGEEGLDGFDAVELLRQDERAKNIPIIMMTNFFEESKVERAKRLGVVNYINLPSHAIQNIPQIFLTYLNNQDMYVPVHPAFQVVDKRDTEE